MQNMWNDRYRESETVFGPEANQFLVEVAADLEPGTALDLGCGQGRNALWLAEHGPTDPNDALAGATPFLRLMGTTVGGWYLARTALVARELLNKGEGDTAFLEAKITTARFYAEQLLPQTAGLLPMVTAGADRLFEVPISQL